MYSITYATHLASFRWRDGRRVSAARHYKEVAQAATFSSQSMW